MLQANISVVCVVFPVQFCYLTRRYQSKRSTWQKVCDVIGVFVCGYALNVIYLFFKIFFIGISLSVTQDWTFREKMPLNHNISMFFKDFSKYKICIIRCFKNISKMYVWPCFKMAWGSPKLSSAKLILKDIFSLKKA